MNFHLATSSQVENYCNGYSTMVANLEP